MAHDWTSTNRHNNSNSFLRSAEKHLNFKYSKIVADAGYESEENYLWIEQNNQIAFIKPANYEISKTRKYKNDISRIENMSYDRENDCYICKNNKKLTVERVLFRTSKTGYRSEKHSTNVKVVPIVRIKNNVLKETTGVYRWINGQNDWKHQSYL